MLKHTVLLVLFGYAVTCGSPASAQSPPGTNTGVLACKMAPSIGLILGSRQRMACRFVPNGPYPPEAYVGVMNKIGLDIGVTLRLSGWHFGFDSIGPTQV
jgi:Protein of unknown function (DUF992)